MACYLNRLNNEIFKVMLNHFSLNFALYILDQHKKLLYNEKYAKRKL